LSKKIFALCKSIAEWAFDLATGEEDFQAAKFQKSCYAR